MRRQAESSAARSELAELQASIRAKNTDASADGADAAELPFVRAQLDRVKRERRELKDEVGRLPRQRLLSQTAAVWRSQPPRRSRGGGVRKRPRTARWTAPLTARPSVLVWQVAELQTKLKAAPKARASAAAAAPADELQEARRALDDERAQVDSLRAENARLTQARPPPAPRAASTAVPVPVSHRASFGQTRVGRAGRGGTQRSSSTSSCTGQQRLGPGRRGCS